MGYTHYWYRPQVIDQGTYDRIVTDFMRMVPVLRNAGVVLADGCGEDEPVITFDHVIFNGPVMCGHPRNHSIVLPWPSANAGGVQGAGDSISGSWWAGTEIQHRCCDGDCSYETFAFPRDMGKRDTRYEGDLYFDWCKTAFRPYDLAVNVFLIIAKHHLPNMVVRSDGEEAQWFDAKLLCAAELGYGLDFNLSAQSPREMPDEPPPALQPTLERESAAQVAKRLRQALKDVFPGIKFSVTSQTYSGGESIRVRWTDGPTVAQVQEITQGAESIRRDAWGEILSGGNRYVFCDRDISPELRAQALTHLRYEYGRDIDPDHGPYEDHRLYIRTVSEMQGLMPQVATRAARQTSRKPTTKQDKPTTEPPAAPMATFQKILAWSWLVFASKPAQDVLDTLKREGWRWSHKRQAWYNLDGKLPPTCVTYIEKTA